MKTAISIDQQKIAEFCQRHHIRELALFGSVLRDDLRPDSDIDVLVEFQPGHVPGFLRLYDLEQELSRLLGSRKIDLVTRKSLHPIIRERALADAEVLFTDR